jgi:hypothetical protein
MFSKKYVSKKFSVLLRKNCAEFFGKVFLENSKEGFISMGKFVNKL